MVENWVQWILGCVLIFASLGVILAKQPVHASLFFLATLIALAAIYLQLSAQFIAVMQILVYAGAILVIFVFVIVLFQDAYLKIYQHEAQSMPLFLYFTVGVFLVGAVFFGKQLLGISQNQSLPADYGTVQGLGKAIYIDFFFPFEAIVMLFLIAIVGSLYIAKKVK